MGSRCAALALAAVVAQACAGQTLSAPDSGPGMTLEFEQGSMTPSNLSCVVPLGTPECAAVCLGSNGIVRTSEEDGGLTVHWYVDGMTTHAALVLPEGEPRRHFSSFCFRPFEFPRGTHQVKVVVSNASDPALPGAVSVQWEWCIDATSCDNATR